MRFFHFHELAAVSPGFPPLVTKTNGMYLFHGTPASGFLLSPLCIALVKHFFLSSFLSSLLLVFLPSLISFRCPFPSSIPFRPFRHAPSSTPSFAPPFSPNQPLFVEAEALLEASARFARGEEEIEGERKRKQKRKNSVLRAYWTRFCVDAGRDARERR